MSNIRFEKEFEFLASPEVLFHFMTNPKGLKEWFADKVSLEGDTYSFQWDGAEYKAKRSKWTQNKFIRFEFTPDTYIELLLEINDLTQTTFLRIVDCSGIASDQHDFDSIWNNMCSKLKDVAGR